MTAPVMPPTVCLDTEGKFFSRFSFLDMVDFSGPGIINSGLLAEQVLQARGVRHQEFASGDVVGRTR
jgi:hypothetical protein